LRACWKGLSCCRRTLVGKRKWSCSLHRHGTRLQCIFTISILHPVCSIRVGQTLNVELSRNRPSDLQVARWHSSQSQEFFSTICAFLAAMGVPVQRANVISYI
jgi:hypothetical protein